MINMPHMINIFAVMGTMFCVLMLVYNVLFPNLNAWEIARVAASTVTLIYFAFVVLLVALAIKARMNCGRIGLSYMLDENMYWENILLEVSIAYYLYDLILFVIPYTPKDVVIIAHHVATAWLLSVSYDIGHFAWACVLLTVVADVTMPLFQTSNILKVFADGTPMYQRVRTYYKNTFMIVRALLFTPLLITIAYYVCKSDIFSRKKKIGVVSILLLVAIGNILWIKMICRPAQKCQRHSAL